jgi:ubiquinone/menaquinone biosynthesis C-methylase UbiE
MSDIKNWSGERLETFVYNENTIEHLHRYAIALQFVEGKSVLDIASGEGYGSNLLAGKAAAVIGVDIDHASIEVAKKKYPGKNLQFRQGSASMIPVDDNSVDVVVSFETIEHHDQHEEMLKEIKRVLRPGGVLIMSSPDKKYYSDERGYNNPYHVKELYFNDFKKLINQYFKNSGFYFQNMFKGSILVPEGENGKFSSFEGTYESLSNLEFKPLYNLVIASDGEVDESSISVFTSSAVEQYIKGKEIEYIRNEVTKNIKDSWSYKIGNLLLTPVRIFKWSK